MTEFSKLSPGESVDILHKKERRRRSYASLIVKAEKQKSTIDIIVRSLILSEHKIWKSTCVLIDLLLNVY